MERIGQGCSRTAYLREDGKIVKKARYKSSYNSAGRPDYGVVNRMLDQLKALYPENKNLEKVLTLMEKDYYISPPCMGILAEYRVSRYVKNKPASKSFALCEDIKVRKKANVEEISIVGIYENANEKAPRVQKGLSRKLPFIVGDLHRGNYVNGILVDYANLYPNTRW